MALSPEHVVIHRDLLSCGPLPSVESLDDWRDVRESYLRSLDIESPPFSFAEHDRDLFHNRERLRSAQTITLWLGPLPSHSVGVIDSTCRLIERSVSHA